jgi:glutaredoxin-like YruB-family protein
MVTIYSTPTCAYCKAAKQFFTEKNIAYTEIDVAAKPDEAQKMIEKSGQMGVPVIIVEKDGKEEIIVGFDKPKLVQLLGIQL